MAQNDLEDLFGRSSADAQHPALFVGPAMAAGFATARLGKVANRRTTRSPYDLHQIHSLRSS
jgi:hypothetical protein